jgi:hypothetical protein
MNQIPITRFTDEEIFKLFGERIIEFLPNFLLGYSDSDSLEFKKILNDIIVQVVTNKTTMFVDQTVMQLYNQIVSKQCSPFIYIHNQLLAAFVANLAKQLEVKSFSVQMEIDIIDTPVTNFIPVTTTFTPISRPVPLTPLNTTNIKNEPLHIIADGLNFFGRMNETITTHRKDLGCMKIDRRVEKHQFDCQVELMRAFDVAKKFFSQAVPVGSHIHFVIKKFGTRDFWTTFKKHFANTFMNDANPLPHKYDLNIAIPESLNDGECDGECDDRLAARLAYYYNGFLLTMDGLASIVNHWHHKSDYYHIDNNQVEDQTIWYVDDFDLKYLDKIPRIKFDFWIGANSQGIPDICMSHSLVRAC